MANGTVQKIKVHLLHPVTHDFQEFSRGLHDVEPAVASVFLKLKDAITGKPVAELYNPPPAPEDGTKKGAPDSKDAKQQSATQPSDVPPQGKVGEAADSPKRLGGPERRN